MTQEDKDRFAKMTLAEYEEALDLDEARKDDEALDKADPDYKHTNNFMDALSDLSDEEYALWVDKRLHDTPIDLNVVILNGKYRPGAYLYPPLGLPENDGDYPSKSIAVDTNQEDFPIQDSDDAPGQMTAPGVFTFGRNQIGEDFGEIMEHACVGADMGGLFDYLGFYKKNITDKGKSVPECDDKNLTDAQRNGAILLLTVGLPPDYDYDPNSNEWKYRRALVKAAMHFPKLDDSKETAYSVF